MFGIRKKKLKECRPHAKRFTLIHVRKEGSIVNEHAARFIVRLSFVHTFFDSITYTETIC